MERGHHVLGDALEDGVVGGYGRVEERVGVVARLAEGARPARVDEVRVEREVELDVARAGFDRVRDQAALDLDRVRDELVEPVVRVLGRERERVRKSDAAGNVTLKGRVATLREERSLRAAGLSTRRSRSSTRCTYHVTSFALGVPEDGRARSVEKPSTASQNEFRNM